MYGRMHRSVSEPSVGTVGNTTIGTNATGTSGNDHFSNLKARKDKSRGKFLWEGKLGVITNFILMTVWSTRFQALVLVVVVYKFVMHLLLAYYIENEFRLFLEVSLIVTEVVYIVDVIVHILHAAWPLVRLHIRVFRRNLLFLAYDVLSMFPMTLLFKNKPGCEKYAIVGRWLEIARIYRLIQFFQDINGQMRTSRKFLFFSEQLIAATLMLHAGTCLWYTQNKLPALQHPWHNIGYPSHVHARSLKFDSYRTCWYYCTCRFFNVVFGDSFPLLVSQKWLTSCLTLSGYVFFRYRFIGTLAWELVIENTRRANFVDRYHHMINYLRISRAPECLIDQCKNYKLQLWEMKDGILRSDQLNKLPLPLQMELIFDINVGNFHNSMLFRDTKESFMRQISLLMRHELYLEGQHIWSQGVVKSGMICIKRGVIEMLSDEDDESPMIAFKAGTVLGELSLFYSIPSKVTVKAATYVEVQVLRRTDFMRVISEHPTMFEVIRNKISTRLKTARRKQEAIEEYDRGDSRLIRTRYRPMKVLKDNLAGVEEEDPTFVDDSHMYYRDENNVRQPKFTTEYLELYQLSANVTTIDAPHICLRSNFPWILKPNTDFTHMFDIVHFVMVVYVCFMAPYSALQNHHSDTEKVLTTIVVAGLLLNIYIQLTTATVEKNIRKETVKEIAEVKMATFGFYLDVISVFPVSIFTDTLDPQGETVAGQIAMLFPILQVWHIWDYLDKWAKNFNSHVKFIVLTKFCTIFIIFCYWSGCFLYLYACPRKLCRENSWMAQLIYWETKVFMSVEARHETPMKTAFVFGTTVFTGSGSSEIAPGDIDLIVVIALFALGSYLSCFYTARICSHYLLATQRRLKFKESMRELFYFLSVNHVSSKIKARVKKFFCVQWYYNNAVSTEELFKDMSTNIQQEVLSIEMVETLLVCPLFQVHNRDFLQTVASNTRKLVLPDNEVVQHAADIGRDMYILQKGHCNLLNNLGKRQATIGPNSHFGVVEMLFGLPKVYTVVTSTNCILLHVEYSALVQCWGTFPDISHPIITVLENHELKSKAAEYEDAKPLIGRLDVKTNRIAQEIKESFVVLTTREQRGHYVKTFDKLGVLRHIRYIFMPGCITPHGMFLKVWCAVRFALAVFYIFGVPYDIATKQHKHGGLYNWSDVVLYIDIFIMAYVAYYNDKSLLVTHPLLTVTRYLKHAFLLDFISVFPFEEVFRIVNDNTDMDLYRLNRMLLVTRITGAFSYWASDIMRLNPAVVLLKFLPIAVTLVNFATAFIFVNACEPYWPEHSHYILVNCSKILIISSNRYETRYAITEYVYTFYWVYEVFVGLGCTPVGMTNSVDLWLVMCLQITGFLYFAFMFGYVASTRSAAAHALLEHNEKTRDLTNFLYQENVDPMLTAKTLKYFEYVWKRTNGSNPQKICRCLNSALMEDTLVFMYEKALREVPLFGKVERSFIRVITQHLHEMYLLKGDTVIQCRDIQPHIYIIYRGKVDVLTSYNEMITCMGPGGMFGNFTGQPISCSEVTIYASRSLDLLTIPSVTFFNLVKYYPKIQEPLNKAFEMSRDYILPINMEMNDDDDSSEEDSTYDLTSLESGADSKSGSSRFDLSGTLAMSTSQSNVSQSKSSASVGTYHSYSHASNLLRPGTLMFQSFGYVTCTMVTIHYLVGLYDLVTLNDCYLLFWVYAALDIYFYTKIYLAMHQGYVSKHGELIMDGPKCRRRYFKHKIWLWSDILVNFPTEFLGFCFPESVRVIHYLRAIKLFRLKYLFEFYRNTSRELTNNLTTLQAAMTIMVVALMIHTFTCVWLLAMIGTSPISVIRTLKIHILDEEMPQLRWDYVTSFYMVVSQLTTTGSDEFVIDEILPMSILAVILVCGKMLASIVVAASIQLAYSTKYALTAYEKVTKELIDMLKNQGLSSYQLKKFWKYIQQLWVTERGRQLPVLLSQTPYVRRCDLMSAMFGHHLRNCYIFAETGESFLRQLTVALDYTIFFPGNYIVVAGDSDARMYWVASGTVSVVSVRADLTEITHELLVAGDVFGILQGMNRGITHCFSYRAETKVSILTLSLDSWINILPFFPEAKKLIMDRSEILFTQI
ncbi:uncharacterized protein LOC113492021 [Trichoplusia ni]|uniref:Uncharacterized protein LOC113492021 n=1 Tax=Trichoplusia ni TaxID=7111 RepID=A0A7E5V9Y7_TRINI|nr:uncharacterized protein LOC113492021 [Trichoplusia ni]